MRSGIGNLLRGIPPKRVELLENYERQGFKISLLENDFETKKSLGKIPEVLYGDAQKKIKEARTILGSLKKALDEAGNNREHLELISTERVPQIEEAIRQIKVTVRGYIYTLERIEKQKEYFASRKQYWDSLREDSARLIEQLKSQISDIERKIKENEEKMRELPPVPEELLPWLTKLKALKNVLEDIKNQLSTEQSNLITWEVRSIYTETAENRVKIQLDKLKREGETGLVSLEGGEGMKELLEISSKISEKEEDEWRITEEYVKSFGPKAEASVKVTREEVERFVDEHLATMESKWREAGWLGEDISKETEKERKKLWERWEPHLK